MRKLPVAGPEYDYKLENIRNSIIEEEFALTHRKLENIELGAGDLIFTDDSGNQKTVRTLQTAVDDPSTGLAATASAVSTLSTNVTTLDGEVTALSSSVTTLSTTVGTNTTSISTNTSSINGIEGKYAVKINNNNHVSGFGLISTANNATPTSVFTVTADAFKIVDTSGAATPTAPFEVYTSSRTVDGVSVPAGVYMDNAFITSASIKTLDADVITAGTINADRLSVDGTTIDTSGGNLIVKTGGVDTTQIASDAVSGEERFYDAGGTAISGTTDTTIATFTLPATLNDKFFIETSVAWFTMSGWTASSSYANLKTFLAGASFSISLFHGSPSTSTMGGISQGGIFVANSTGNLSLQVKMSTNSSLVNITPNQIRCNVIQLKR